MIQTQEAALSRRQQQWNVLLPAGFAMALALAGDLTLYAVLPAYAAGLGIGLASLGLLLSANRLIRLVSNPLVGMLSGRVRRRGLVLAGLTTGMLSTLLYVLAHGFWVFLLGRVLWGISWSLLYIGIYCMILDVTEPEERGWGSGMLQTFYFAGLAINPLIGGFLSARFGFVNALLVCAGLQALGLLGAVLFLPDTHPVAVPGDAQARPRFSPARWWAGVREWLGGLSAAWFSRNRVVISANTLYLLTLFIGDGIIMSTITLYLQQRYGSGIGSRPGPAAGRQCRRNFDRAAGGGIGRGCAAGGALVGCARSGRRSPVHGRASLGRHRLGSAVCGCGLPFPGLWTAGSG